MNKLLFYSQILLAFASFAVLLALVWAAFTLGVLR